MDFFEYASLAQMFVNTDTWYVPFIVGGLCFLAVFIFQAVGLFIIAGREGYKNRWMAFIPFLNTYYIGVCGQKNRVFKGVDTKILALSACIIEFLLVVGYIVYFVAWIELINAGCVYEVLDDAYGFISEYVLKNVPISLAWAGWCFEYLNKYILSIVELIYLALEIFVLSAFFQTYAARRYMLFTITSVFFPIQGILIFILRNNRGMGYGEYMRREQERQYRMYQQYRQQQGFDNNPYNQNPYSSNPYDTDYGANRDNGANRSAGSYNDPFSEFGSNDNGGSNNSNGNNSDPFDL
ncbi:MAG: hypothetical protein HDQ88_06285 [Clostridia bacterium]|nr:hypothetical protein [Clostridia bacterium]